MDVLYHCPSVVISTYFVKLSQCVETLYNIPSVCHFILYAHNLCVKICYFEFFRRLSKQLIIFLTSHWCIVGVNDVGILRINVHLLLFIFLKNYLHIKTLIFIIKFIFT